MLARSCTRTFIPLRISIASRFYVQSFQLTTRKMVTLPRLPVFEALAVQDPKHTAVVHSISGRKYSYGELLHDVVDAKNKLSTAVAGADLSGQRIAYLVENSYDYVGAGEQLGLEQSQKLIFSSDSACNSSKRCDCLTNGSQLPGCRTAIYSGRQRSISSSNFKKIRV